MTARCENQEDVLTGSRGAAPYKHAPSFFVGAAIGRPLPQVDITQADEQCSPLRKAGKGDRNIGRPQGRRPLSYRIDSF